MSRDDANPEKPRIIATIEATEPTLKPNSKSVNFKKVKFDSKVHTKTFYAASSESEEDDEILTDQIHNLSIQEKEDSILAPDSEAEESFLISESDSSCSSPIISRSMPLNEITLPLKRPKKIAEKNPKNDFELWKRDMMFDIYSIKRFLTNLEKKIEKSNKWE